MPVPPSLSVTLLESSMRHLVLAACMHTTGRFCPAAGAGAPLMAAGSGAGVITVWNLEERKLHTVIRDAHDAPVTALHFFAGEPRLMSAGADNALKQWVRVLATFPM